MPLIRIVIDQDGREGSAAPMTDYRFGGQRGRAGETHQNFN